MITRPLVALILFVSASCFSFTADISQSFEGKAQAVRAAILKSKTEQELISNLNICFNLPSHAVFAREEYTLYKTNFPGFEYPGPQEDGVFLPCKYLNAKTDIQPDKVRMLEFDMSHVVFIFSISDKPRKIEVAEAKNVVTIRALDSEIYILTTIDGRNIGDYELTKLRPADSARFSGQMPQPTEKDGRPETTKTPREEDTKCLLRSDQELVKVLALRLEPTGVLIINGNPFLLFLGKKEKVGNELTVTFEGADYRLTIVEISSRDFRVRYRSEEFTRPVSLR